MSQTIATDPGPAAARPPGRLAPRPVTPPRVRAGASVRTYRYLRLSLVALVGLLLASVWLERLTGDPAHAHLGSISAYFYTPARSIFVATLVALGISLVAIVGRRGFEDSALNLAGMLAPIVAFVPTPRGAGGAPCDPDGRCSVPTELVPSVVNNVTCLIGLGLAGIVLGIVTNVRNPHCSRATVLGCAAAILAWAAFTAWFVLGRESFLGGAHFGAAGPLFTLITLVALVNARKARRRRGSGAGSAGSAFMALYGLVATVMAVTLATAVVLAVMDQVGGGGTPNEWVLWVEVVMLVAFGAFWVAQTVDYWADGVPEEARETLGAVA